MGSGKHAADNNTYDYDFSGPDEPKKSGIAIKIIIVIIIIALVVAGGFGLKKYLDNKKAEETSFEPASDEPVGLPTEYEGYSVIGKIKIDKIGVEQFILNSSEEDALEKGVTKLYGGELNDYGNFCIIGHNYENIFEKLAELEVGDIFTIIDPDLEETAYKIQEITSIEPDNLEGLLANDEQIEMTLITCENGATTRLMVKAIKVDENAPVTEDENQNVVESNTTVDTEEIE